MKKVLVTVLALIICLSSLSVLAVGKEFTDLKNSDWFYNDVKTAVELGLVNGRTESTYAPADKLTYAEAIKLAACMHQLYTTGKIDIKPGDPWYMPYVDYCKNNNIIKNDYNYQENATRAGYMGIFANALPGSGLKEINSIADNSIPDVPSSASYAAGVYKLYRAGILQGVDAAHNCNPHNNITRAEVAAILTRMMNSDKRVKFTLGEEKVEREKLAIESKPASVTVSVNETAVCEVSVKGGTAPYKYQWYYVRDNTLIKFKDSDVEGVLTKKLSVTKKTVEVIDVRCVITDATGANIVSPVATITIKGNNINNKLELVVPPSPTTVKVGEDAKLSVETKGGSGTLTYKWQMDISGKGGWINMTENAVWLGTKTPELTVKSNTAANLLIRCIITDTTNNVTIETEGVNIIFE